MEGSVSVRVVLLIPRTSKCSLAPGCGTSNGTEHSLDRALKTYKSGKDTSCFVEKLVIAFLDQVVVLSQIDGLVG